MILCALLDGLVLHIILDISCHVGFRPCATKKKNEMLTTVFAHVSLLTWADSK